MTDRKFYRTVIHVEILSEDPYTFTGNLVDVASDISAGDCSGITRTIHEETCNGARMAQFLLAQGSDPAFFMLDDEGNDTN